VLLYMFNTSVINRLICTLFCIRCVVKSAIMWWRYYCFFSLFFVPHPDPWCFLLFVTGLISLPSWLVICLAFVFQVFLLSLSVSFLCWLSVDRSDGQSVGVGHRGSRWWSVLEAQRSADGRRQDHAEDDAADDDHDLLLQGGRREGRS